jgi:hypothetical protein
MAYTFKLRRGTAVQWTAKNPILQDGEPGIESDTKKFKIGDGIHLWSQLPYYLSQDAMMIYINEALATADPISPDQIDVIVDRVAEQFEIPDLTLVWENAKA